MKVRAEARRLTAPLPGGREGATVVVEPLEVGQVQIPRTMLERSSHFARLRQIGIGTPRSKWIWVPVPAFLIHHPSVGAFLVDTGLHPSVAAQPTANMGAIASRFARPRLEPGRDLPAQLRERGLEARNIKLVVMTHMHLDHTSGMSEFPGATFLLTEEEWVAATTERNSLLHGYRPAHYDYAFDYRCLSYDAASVSSYGSFGRTFDLFGDGSVRLASTPGHSAGHQSVICRLENRDFVIAGDAIYTIGQLSGAPEPPRPYDEHNWRRSMRELKRFAEQYPHAVIVPGHDAEHWKTLSPQYE